MARSHECDFPEAVTRLPVCTSPRYAGDGSSYEIDQKIRAILQEASSVYRVDADRLDELAPDVLITQTQCDVCAVSLAQVEEAACQLVRSRPRIVSLEAATLGDVWRDVERVGEAVGEAEAAHQLIVGLRNRLIRLALGTQKQAQRPSVACVEWFAPLMAAGNWIPELVEIAGGRNLLGAAGEHSPWLGWDELTSSDPDVIVLMPCGFDVERTLGEAAALRNNDCWEELRAVRQGRVYAVDGNRFFSRPGPRLVESAEVLAEILHPDVCDFGHRGSGWQQLS